MILFTCPNCNHQVFFTSSSCVDCAATLVYQPATDAFETGTDDGACRNRDTVEACNWAASVGSEFCRSCALDTEHTPTADRLAFQNAKRRTLRQLFGLGVEVESRTPALAFELAAGTDEAPITTGHADGLITLDTSEADPAHREELRQDLGEPYRTPLGHVRHELGHWWWATAIDDGFSTGEFRSLFGDESLDYQQALSDHYGAPDDGAWRDAFVSHYAASHAWEDFAESFAHYLHIVDTTETAVAHRLVDDLAGRPFAERYDQWIDLTTILNDLNRSMGTPDPYPFVVPAPAVAKIAFVAASLTDAE